MRSPSCDVVSGRLAAGPNPNGRRAAGAARKQAGPGEPEAGRAGARRAGGWPAGSRTAGGWPAGSRPPQGSSVGRAGRPAGGQLKVGRRGPAGETVPRNLPLFFPAVPGDSRGNNTSTTGTFHYLSRPSPGTAGETIPQPPEPSTIFPGRPRELPGKQHLKRRNLPLFSPAVPGDGRGNNTSTGGCWREAGIHYRWRLWAVQNWYWRAPARRPPKGWTEANIVENTHTRTNLAWVENMHARTSPARIIRDGQAEDAWEGSRYPRGPRGRAGPRDPCFPP